MDYLGKSRDLVQRDIQALLRAHFWPETLDPSKLYRIQGDDQDGRQDTNWIRIAFGDSGDVALIDEDTKVGFTIEPQYGGGGRFPLVRNALLIMAEAIRLDTLYPDSYEEPEYPKERSPELRMLHDLLQGFPSPVDADGYALIVKNHDEQGGPVILDANLTPYNDVWIGINFNGHRIRSGIGGGHKLRVYESVIILAEAIRLENEGST